MDTKGTDQPTPEWPAEAMPTIVSQLREPSNEHNMNPIQLYMANAQ